ncbi:MAG: hypothetical protein NWE78_01415 [Candidatus Bathyarchaeota archaeon]|nr:hypothetical protein [Candidatus Bathyarchaeota archaeon]
MYPVVFPELAYFSFKFKRAITQSRPTIRISFEFDGHLSLAHPACPLKRPVPNITLLNYSFRNWSLFPPELDNPVFTVSRQLG